MEKPTDAAEPKGEGDAFDRDSRLTRVKSNPLQRLESILHHARHLVQQVVTKISTVNAPSFKRRSRGVNKAAATAAAETTADGEMLDTSDFVREELSVEQLASIRKAKFLAWVKAWDEPETGSIDFNSDDDRKLYFSKEHFRTRLLESDAVRVTLKSVRRSFATILFRATASILPAFAGHTKAFHRPRQRGAIRSVLEAFG